MIETVPTRISHLTPKLDQNIMLFVRLLRAIGLKLGSASMLEAIDAAKTVGVADKDFLYHALVSCLIKTMGVLLKYQDDISRIQGSEAARILSEVQAALVQGELSRA